MTWLAPPTLVQALRRAAVRATLAPSVHNTQPWRFVLGPQRLEIHSDPTRRLQVLDPAGRQMLISCGCALFNARASLAAAGYDAHVERFPDLARPQVAARITVDGEPDPQRAAASTIGALDTVIERRHTNRRRFTDDMVPAEFVDELIAAAATEGAELIPIVTPEQRMSVAVVSQRADAQENADPAYRAELRAWTHDEPGRDDGVPALVIPRGGAGAHDDVPIRDFDTQGAGALPTETHSSLNQCLLLLGTDTDSPAAWLGAGEALERILLEAARRGYAVSPLTQVIEVVNTRAMLRAELHLAMQPHVLLRVGQAPSTPATRRRRLVDMLTDAA